ncbi:hypothetical protein [Polynucleobacter necessarius]|uniref:hypothetical protein n=1 Tax=Polynucleobacter necessarius TaxID=576610 RepID=UPI0018D4E210|nr:hypothetical protein [Polynucleobacter necessarius]
MHLIKPSNLKTAVSVVLLIISLIVVVVLAELLSPAIEAGVKAAGAPKTIVGIAIAMLVLCCQKLMPQSEPLEQIAYKAA